MKRLLAFVLAALMVLSLCACTDKKEEAPSVVAGEADIAKLDSLYAGRQPYHGELHDHANTGGWSDGKTALSVWKTNMMIKDMDFATFADHKQVLHMYLPEWDSNLFIGGTEASTDITDSKASNNTLHYNMLFAEPTGFEAVLTQFPGYGYVPNETHSNRYYYAKFDTATFMKVAEAVTKNGGFFVHVHPKAGEDYIVSDDPLDYWFGDGTGLEVMTGAFGYMNEPRNQAAYELWVDLLELGKRVYATSGSDSHRVSNVISLTTIYSDQANAAGYLNYVRKGDFVAGPVGIRMAVGDTTMGGATKFDGQRLVVSVGDYHSQAYQGGCTYRLDVYDDSGLVFSQEMKGNDTKYFAIDADPEAKFYRATVTNVSLDRMIAVGNPIWNG